MSMQNVAFLIISKPRRNNPKYKFQMEMTLVSLICLFGMFGYNKWATRAELSVVNGTAVLSMLASGWLVCLNMSVGITIEMKIFVEYTPTGSGNELPLSNELHRDALYMEMNTIRTLALNKIYKLSSTPSAHMLLVFLYSQWEIYWTPQRLWKFTVR